MKERFAIEPNVSEEGVVTLRFRIRNGALPISVSKSTTIQHRFLCDQNTLDDVLQFVESLELVPLRLEESTAISCSLSAPKLTFSRSGADKNILSQTLRESLIDVDSVVWVHIDQ